MDSQCTGTGIIGIIITIVSSCVDGLHVLLTEFTYEYALEGRVGQRYLPCATKKHMKKGKGVPCTNTYAHIACDSFVLQYKNLGTKMYVYMGNSLTWIDFWYL